MGVNHDDADGSLIKNAFLLFDKMSELQKKLPVAYAVFQMVLDDKKNGASDAKYLYANDRFCKGEGHLKDELVGHLVSETYPGDSRELIGYGYEAAFLGKEIHETMYSKELNHWMEFVIAPTNIEGCCIAVCSFIDDSHLERELLRRNSTTDDAIVRIARLLNRDDDYENTMNHVLNEISLVVHPSRLTILVVDGINVSEAFEWRTPNSKFPKGTKQQFDYYKSLADWRNYANHGDVVQMDDIKIMEKDNEELYRYLKSFGVERFIAAPFFDNHHNLLGFLCAENFELDDMIDTIKLIESISYFIAFRIRNHSLLQLLDYRSTHDELTGLKNRRVFGDTLKIFSKEKREYGIFYVDLNFFKNTNDTYGHHVGNEVLQATAKRLQEASHHDVFRLGGDEFAILVDDDIPQEDYDEIFNNIEKFFDEPIIETDEYSITISASVGYARAPYDSTSPNELRKIADQRMYERKKIMHKQILEENGSSER